MALMVDMVEMVVRLAAASLAAAARRSLYLLGNQYTQLHRPMYMSCAGRIAGLAHTCEYST